MAIKKLPPSAGGGITELTGPVTAGPASGSTASIITPTGVAAASYGSSTQTVQVTVNAAGQITAISNVTITGGATGVISYSLCQGRLTTESGVPVSTSDRTAQATIYFTPYLGNLLGVYDGVSAWVMFGLTEISLALSSLTSGKNYDVFVYSNAGVLTLELSAAWTDDVTRATALVLQDGVPVKSGATTRRWIGTLRTTGTTTTEDSAAKRFLWNAYNRVPRPMANTPETTDTWNYTTATFRQANANTANQLAYVTGDIGTSVEALVTAMHSSSNGSNATNAVGVDSTSTPSGTMSFGVTGVQLSTASYQGYPGLGYHFLAWLEFSVASGTTTWYGDAGVAYLQSGITGTVLG